MTTHSSVYCRGMVLGGDDLSLNALSGEYSHTAFCASIGGECYEIQAADLFHRMDGAEGWEDMRVISKDNRVRLAEK